MGRGRTLNGYQFTVQTLYGGIEWVGEVTEWVSGYSTNALWWDRVGRGRTLNGYRYNTIALGWGQGN